ncbi:MAG: biotin--[acetyl-CoA-carboxylase] ligase [Bacteroidales bacterium]|nr:biotin--[acetyl-CoA-carboxylase] ligase [Bacteroidales bacterium]
MAKKHDIMWLDTVDSTNEEARRRISSLDNLSVLSAFRQTAGRGQRGSSWSSVPGENLTFSIVLKYGPAAMMPLRATDQCAISELTALSVTDLLSSHGIEAKIKWPNDIYVGGRKICGILIEHSVRDSYLASSIIGIGLNVNQTVFDPSIPNPVSMILCSPEKFQPSALLEEFMDIFGRYCNRYLNITGGLARLRKLYLSQMWLKDVPSRFIDYTAGHEFEGIIRGLTDIGHLIVEDMEKGELREFAFKEIGYIIRTD